MTKDAKGLTSHHTQVWDKDDKRRMAFAFQFICIKILLHLKVFLIVFESLKSIRIKIHFDVSASVSGDQWCHLLAD